VGRGGEGFNLDGFSALPAQARCAQPTVARRGLLGRGGRYSQSRRWADAQKRSGRGAGLDEPFARRSKFAGGGRPDGGNDQPLFARFLVCFFCCPQRTA